MDEDNEEPLEARDRKIDELDHALDRVRDLLKFIASDDKLYEEEGWGKAPAGTKEALDAFLEFFFSDELENFYMNQQIALEKYRKEQEKECFDG